MKVVANTSFFGAGVNARKGDEIEISDTLGKAWLEAGLVSSTDDQPAEATTSDAPADEVVEPSEPVKTNKSKKGSSK